MFSKILGRKKEDIGHSDRAHNEMVHKISQMNLTDMRSYIMDKVSGFKSTEDGLIEIMRRLNTLDEKGKRHIEMDDMDTKKKKGFDLVIAIASHRRVTVVAIEMISEFLNIYHDILKKYDTDHKEIYESRIKDAVAKAVFNIGEAAELKRKMDILGE